MTMENILDLNEKQNNETMDRKVDTTRCCSTSKLKASY